jgi:hypothetical protein
VDKSSTGGGITTLFPLERDGHPELVSTLSN